MTTDVLASETRRARRSVAAAGIVLVLANIVGPAGAAPVPGTPSVVLAPLGAEDAGFVLPALAVTQGGSLTLVNLDTVSHDIVCDKLDANRRPVCKSDLIATGGTSAVAGVDKLPPDVYAMHCQAHPQMVADLTVVDTP